MDQLIIKRPYICRCNCIECCCVESKDKTRFRINMEYRWLEKTQTSLTEKVASQHTEPFLNLGINYLSCLELITIRNNWEELKSLSKNILQILLGLIYIIMERYKWYKY